MYFKLWFLRLVWFETSSLMDSFSLYHFQQVPWNTFLRFFAKIYYASPAFRGTLSAIHKCPSIFFQHNGVVTFRGRIVVLAATWTPFLGKECRFTEWIGKVYLLIGLLHISNLKYHFNPILALNLTNPDLDPILIDYKAILKSFSFTFVNLWSLSPNFSLKEALLGILHWETVNKQKSLITDVKLKILTDKNFTNIHFYQ